MPILRERGTERRTKPLCFCLAWPPSMQKRSRQTPALQPTPASFLGNELAQASVHRPSHLSHSPFLVSSPQTHQALRFCAFSTSCQIFSRCTKARVGRHHVSVSTVRNIKMTRLWSLPTWEPGLLTREWPPCAIEASQRVTPMGFPGPITVLSQESSLSVAPGLRGPCCCVTVCEMMKLAVNSGPI